MKEVAKKILNILINILPIYKNKILFQSGRNKVDCSPYAIYKYIKDNKIDNFKCIWLVEKNTDVSMLPKKDYCYYNSIKGVYHQATAKYWIRSQSLGGLKKRKKQIYIQMWHGAGALKKSGYDCLPEEQRPTKPIEHVRDWDYFIATDEENAKAIISSTNYQGKLLILGNADTDYIINATPNQKLSVLKELKIENNKKKIILYAPTFRDNELNENVEKYNLPINILKELKDYIVLVRLHPLMNKIVKKLELPPNFINVGYYSNINNLYLITDILITDYSSIIFPFSVLNKPIIFYPYDYDKYIKLRGDFYLDYKKLPGPICYTEEELLQSVLSLKKSKYKEKLNNFNKKYNYLNDGHVCEKFVNMLKNKEFK